MVDLIIRLTDQEYNTLRLAAEYSDAPLETFVKELTQSALPPHLIDTAKFTNMPDEMLLAIAHSQMDENELQRLTILRQLTQPDWAEQEEHAYLQRKYWLGQFRKTYAMLEAQKRGLF